MHHVQAIGIQRHDTAGTNGGRQTLPPHDGLAYPQMLNDGRLDLNIDALTGAPAANGHQIHAHRRLPGTVAPIAGVHWRHPVLGWCPLARPVAASGAGPHRLGAWLRGAKRPQRVTDHSGHEHCDQHNPTLIGVHDPVSPSSCSSSIPPVKRAIRARCFHWRASAARRPTRACNRPSSALMTASTSPRPLA